MSTKKKNDLPTIEQIENAVIYARYSPGPRQTDQSIEGQVRDCMEYAKSHGIKVIDVYVDKKISGTDFEGRASFKRMIRDAEKKQFQAIIVWKIDRFGRDREEIALNKVKVKRYGVRILYAKEVIPDGPEGIILESLMEGLTEYYIADLRQKILRGQRESAIKGYAVGVPPLGYDVKERRYVLNESEAWIVRYVFKAYDEGKTAPEIIRYIDEHGGRSKQGKSITKNGIYTILRNRKYIGEAFYDDIAIPVPAIVSKELWDSVHSKLTRHQSRSATYKAVGKYQLSMRAYCGECGSPLIGESGYGKQGVRYSYYKCSCRKKRHGCKLPVIRQDALEDLVVEHTLKTVLQDDLINYIADRVMEIQAKNDAAENLKGLKNSLRETEKALKNILHAIEQGIITPSTKERVLALEEQSEGIKTEIAREEIKKPTLTREQIVYWLKLFKKGDIADPDFVTRLLDVFVYEVVLYKEKAVIAYNYTDNNGSDRARFTATLRGSDMTKEVELQGLEPGTDRL